MFLTGEFSKIARVSKRMLQYYDAVGLFKPEQTDPQTGYRYYSAHQLPALNRILALKDLGLTLEQITQMVEGGITDQEIQTIFARQKSELETRILEDMQRLRRIEARLKQPQEALPDVVIKAVPPQPVISINHFCLHVEDGFQFIAFLLNQIPHHVPIKRLGSFYARSPLDGFEAENTDLEFGFFMEEAPPAAITIEPGITLESHLLPGVDTMVTLAHVGGPRTSHLAYGVLGTWIEDHGYRLDGLPREIFVELPRTLNEQDTVMEIQIPVAIQTSQSPA